MSINKSIAVAYLARGADKDCFLSFQRFVNSYRYNSAGINHSLYIIFKGFSKNTDLKKAKTIFSNVKYNCIFLQDNGLDIGAYIELSRMIKEDYISVFNTSSEILTKNWLLKLVVNLELPNIGLVGATGSYECLEQIKTKINTFPNIHIRSSAFLLERKLFVNLTNNITITKKLDAYRFESGPESLTRQILGMDKKILIVGRNGRGYSPEFWPRSNTFRLGNQNNLLIADNQTRNFSNLTCEGKSVFVFNTWGKFIRDDQVLKVKKYI